MDAVIYKSKYSKVCEIIGRAKPKTQSEEDYCQTVEFEHPEFALKILKEMCLVKTNKDSFINTIKKYNG